jgi:hypothetical protein
VTVVVRLGVIFIVRNPPCHSSSQIIHSYREVVKCDGVIRRFDRATSFRFNVV